MLKYIYVDTENLATDRWYHVIKYLTPRDTLFLPWSQNSSRLTLQLLAQLGFPKCKVQFIECNVGTPNAMDFILTSVVTQQVLSARKSFHIILSGDKGYDPAIAHLIKEFNVKIMRCTSWGEYLNKHREEFVDCKWCI